jgi:hypothetical protein
MKKGIAYELLMPLSKILNLVPTDMVLDNLAFKIDDNGNKTNINFQNYVCDKQLRLHKSRNQYHLTTIGNLKVLQIKK